MTDASPPLPPRISWKEALMLGCAMIGPIAVVGGALQTNGGRDKQLDDNTRRIEKLETRDLNVNVLGERMARIETTLDMLVALKKAEK